AINVRILITIAITKYRIIVLEYDVLTRWLFRSSQLLGFSDLHYEHVESISVGTPNLSMPRLYTSISLVSLGWVLFDGYQSFGLNTEFFSLVAILMIIGGIINVFFSLPFGGVFIVIKSISGETIKIAENKLPAFFIDDLIINCRTFLTYGAK
ncbi:MAG: hypothetical protein OEY49_02175, partial [Candidatus Heimdallarchaeota archaeon]|nr:hypothetical protein [Candidatus Heimdallarchaeota archaeon]